MDTVGNTLLSKLNITMLISLQYRVFSVVGFYKFFTVILFLLNNQDFIFLIKTKITELTRQIQRRKLDCGCNYGPILE